MKVDSILVNTPVSSPLHPQANLPLLKGYLTANGFRSRIIDTNILFFHWFLGEKDFRLTMEETYDNPLKILSFYSRIEKELFDNNKEYDGLDVGIRYLSNKYNRINFDHVIASLEDKTSNPFIDFYNELIEQRFKDTGIKIVGIAIFLNRERQKEGPF